MRQKICGHKYNFTLLQTLIYKEASNIDAQGLSKTHIVDRDESEYACFKLTVTH